MGPAESEDRHHLPFLFWSEALKPPSPGAGAANEGCLAGVVPEGNKWRRIIERATGAGRFPGFGGMLPDGGCRSLPTDIGAGAQLPRLRGDRLGAGSVTRGRA